jgi:tRNA pseudouridine55 synthase
MECVGLLLVDKPEGPTSHDTVARVRRMTGVRRIGHTGTLDPFASGLLILCLGWATRLAEFLTVLPKAYRGVIRLGESTDTDDCKGKVIARDSGWRGIDDRQVHAALDRQVGEIEQVPPAYSAKRVAGERAYAVARKGGKPELKTEQVIVSRLSVLDFTPPDIAVEIECSSGTYVRAVARDVGEALGVGAHLARLRRLRIGDFSVEDAVSLDRDPSREAILSRLIPPEMAVAHLQALEVGPASASALRHGRPIEASGKAGGSPVAVLWDGSLVAVAEPRGDMLWPRKVFRN